MPRPEAALFLSELDKTDRIADSLADRLAIECPHEEPAVPGDFLEALEDALEPGSASRLRSHLKALVREVLDEEEEEEIPPAIEPQGDRDTGFSTKADISDLLGK